MEDIKSVMLDSMTYNLGECLEVHISNYCCYIFVSVCMYVNIVFQDEALINNKIIVSHCILIKNNIKITKNYQLNDGSDANVFTKWLMIDGLYLL